MTGPRMRVVATLACFAGIVMGGFDAHLAPQISGVWHGITGAPSVERIAAALGAALLVWVMGAVTNVRAFLWMSAGLLPLIPAILGVGSALLFFTGFTTAILFAVLFAISARDLVPRLPRITPLRAGFASFFFFLLVGRALPGPAGPQGDEPHYLLIAESLLRDGDVDLKNQFEEKAYLKFTSGDLEPHTAPRSPREHLYAIHTPGLSGLIAPGYALGGFAGARATVSAVMALAVAFLVAASAVAFGETTAVIVFLVATFASPLPVYANALFPDSVATLPVAATLAYLLRASSASLVTASISIAALPWLHPRFAPLGLLLAGSIAFRDGFSARRAVAVVAPLVISLGLLLLHFDQLFGAMSLSAAYGPGFRSDVSVARIPWGGTALLIDRQFGLLLLSPLLLAGLRGLVELARDHRAVAGLSAGVVLSTIAIGGAFSMWWGGASPPARFLISATPALLLATGVAWASVGARRSMMAGLAGFGMGLLGIACLAPRVLHNRSDGESGLLRLLAPVLDLDRFFPGFVAGTFDFGMAALWGAVVVAMWFRPKVAAGLAATSLVLGTLTAPNPLLDPFDASLRALESWSDRRHTFGGSDSAGAFELDVPLGDLVQELHAGDERYSPRFSLPEGAWTWRIESEAAQDPGTLNVARLSLVEDRDVALVSTTLRTDQRITSQAFALESAKRRVRLRVEGLQARVRIVSVRLTPSSP